MSFRRRRPFWDGVGILSLFFLFLPSMPSQFIDVRALRTKFVHDSLHYAPAVLIPAAVSVASVSIFTRLLTTVEYGLYSVVAAALTIATMVAAGWIEQATLRYLPEYETANASRQVTGNIVGLLLAVCGLVTAVVVIVALAAPRPLGAYTNLLYPACALFIGEAGFVVFGAMMRARLQSRSISLLRIFGAISRFAFALGFVLWVGRDVRWLLIGAAIGRGLVTLLTLAFTLRGTTGWTRPRIDRAVFDRFWGYGMPMVGWTLGSQVLGLSDRFVIEAFHGSGPVGVYSANYNVVSMGLGLLSTPLLMAAHPLIVAAWKDSDATRMPHVISWFSSLYVLGVMPILVALTLTNHALANVLLGEPFRPGSGIIPVIVLGIFVWGFAMYGHKGLELAERTHVMFVLVAITAAFDFVLNLIFVPKYGYAAAAWTTLVSYALYPVLVHWISRRYIPWRIPWRAIAVAVVGGVFAGSVGAACRPAFHSLPPIVSGSLTAIVVVLAYASAVTLAFRRGWGKLA